MHVLTSASAVEAAPMARDGEIRPRRLRCVTRARRLRMERVRALETAVVRDCDKQGRIWKMQIRK
ncbi:MAG: hypothetical protein CMH69_18035 [Nitratireductor sp.]|nr:hypothetical protein [Nitratireductor sp.]